MAHLLRRLAILAVFLGAIIVAASYPIYGLYKTQSVRAQRFEQDRGLAALTGEVGTPIGSPQEYIIDDTKAFLPGKSADGARLLDEKYLNEHHIYPLQLRTVAFIAQSVRYAAYGVMALGVLFLVISGMVRASTKTAAPTT